MRRLRFCLCVALLAALQACVNRGAAPSASVVFAGPVELPLHEDIKPKSKVVARVHHGDKLEVVLQRRRLYKLRTFQRVEGWTDERNLMSAEQMQSLENLEKHARAQPSQGVASTYEVLNVHTEPQRFSPSFVQIREGEKFDVIAHQTAPRAEPAHRVLVKTPPPFASSKKKTDRKKLPPPPLPPGPKPPDDWVELSEERQPPPPAKDAKAANEDAAEAEPVPTDDWTLVRTAKGVAGWVLTSRIYLAIPDEVAQYAEGHRITTYFSLGKIRDDELNLDKDIWLWTTIHAGQHPFDFDSFRVFTWNPKRHRYETAYIQRTVEGFLPVLVRKEGGEETFSVCLADDNGARFRKRFAIVDRHVHVMDVQPCVAQPIAGTVAISAVPSARPEPPSFTDKLKQRLAGR